MWGRAGRVDTPSVTTASPALLVPPVRLGRLLGEARVANGEGVDDLVRRCGLAFDEEFFTRVELGRAELDEPLVRWLAELYGVSVGQLVPVRSELIIDLTEAQMSVGERHVPLTGAEPDQILTNYLALVYALRGLPVGSPIPLRHGDVRVLGEALDRSPRAITHSLGRLMDTDTAGVQVRARGLRRRVVVPLAGILVGVTAVGGLLLVRSPDARAADPPTAPADLPELGVAEAVPAQIGDAAVMERSSPSEPGVQATR